jgi:pimeloyl-ACP methyl ester carboxylesterase
MTRTLLIALISVACIFGLAGLALGAESPTPPFGGEKTTWHGFDRYDFVIDEVSLSITPMKAAEDEKDGIKHTVDGQRRCIVVVPMSTAPATHGPGKAVTGTTNPRVKSNSSSAGFILPTLSPASLLGPAAMGRLVHVPYRKARVVQEAGFVGMSRGGEFAYTWAAANPDRVSCIYADNTGSNPEVFRKLGDLAVNDVPLLLVCGSIDPLLGKNALAIESIYQQFGGRVSIMIKEGAGHHPHSLRDPKPIVDFIVQSFQQGSNIPPTFAGDKFTRNSFYSVENMYRDFPTEATYLTCRGPEFTKCYDRYAFGLAGVEGAITVIVPKAEAPDRPWVFRSDFVNRDATVDLALLAKGFYIVTGPVPYNADGPRRADWDAVYNHLVDHGFSRRPVMEGAGMAAGEAYAWAIENPDKVSCIYSENPVLRSNLSKKQPLDNLAPLANARVPILHVCGSHDPWLNDQTRVAESRYKELGGKITIIVKEGEGHYPLAPKDPHRLSTSLSRTSWPSNTGCPSNPSLLALAPATSRIHFSTTQMPCIRGVKWQSLKVQRPICSGAIWR